MHAAAVTAFTGPEAVRIVRVPVPDPGRGQVRVRVRAAAVNPVDLATTTGEMADVGATLDRRRTRLGLGWDVAGTVDALGAETTGFAVGDRVIGLSTVLDARTKTHAEYAVLDADALAHAPDGVDLVQASTLPLNGLSALQALDLLGLPAGASVLVTGAAGAVGGYAVQLAVLRGLRVVALAGAGDEDLVRRLGATHFLARTDAPAQQTRALVPGGVDGVVDAAVLGIRAHDAVREGGAYVTLIPGTEPAGLRGTRTTGVAVRHHAGELAQLSTLARLGVLTPRVAGTHPLREAAEAYRRTAKGGLRGRLVLVP